MDTNLITRRMNELIIDREWVYTIVIGSNFYPGTTMIAITIDGVEQKYGVMAQNNGMYLCNPLLPNGTFPPINNAVWGLTAEGALTNAVIKQLKGEVFK